MAKRKPRGIRNNNPLNIRRNHANKWQGADPNITDKEFEQFITIQAGLRAAFVLLRNYLIRGISTPRDIIRRWAPPTENNTAIYLRNVCQMAGLNPDVKLRFEERKRLCDLVRAMAIQENGPDYAHFFIISDIQKAYDAV